MGTELDVPSYSQMAHSGHYPQWGGGGEAWCSPTSTSMVLGYYGALPPPSAYRFVPAGHPAPWVDYAARRTYDAAYEGTGNWPFNTAYAAPLAGHAFVTRLRSLREAETFIAAGHPAGRVGLVGCRRADRRAGLVVQRAPAGDRRLHRRTATRSSTTPPPQPPPASAHVYDRAEFENAWLPKSGGLVYVIHDDAHPLPPAPAQANW